MPALIDRQQGAKRFPWIAGQIQPVVRKFHSSIVFWSNPMNIYCVVLNWNDWASTTLCVKSLFDNGVAPEHVLIVDNASTDGSADCLRRELPEVPLVVSPRNLGFAAGMNFGAKQILEKCADDDAIIFVNNDALIVGGMAALKAALARKDVGLVSPVILNREHPEQVHFQGSDYDWSRAEIVFYDKEMAARRESDGLIDSPRVVGAAVAVSLDFIRKVGLFDESLFMYYEDDDLSARSLRAGYRNVVASGFRIAHTGKSSQDAPPHYYFYMKRNEFYFWGRYMTPGRWRWCRLKILSEGCMNAYQWRADPERGKAVREGVLSALAHKTGFREEIRPGLLGAVLFLNPRMTAWCVRTLGKIVKKLTPSTSGVGGMQ